jgi:hypothetical protein
MTQTPTIGRIVLYQSWGSPGSPYASEPRAAIITQVRHAELGDVGLCILNPEGMYFNKSVLYSEEPKQGCWSWPKRA